MTFQDLPLANAILNAITVVLLTLGWIQIKKGNRDAHRKLMTAAFTVSAIFLAGYLTHKFTVGPKLFPMQGWPRWVYFSILIPAEHGYFTTPVMHSVWQRGIWLVGLLALQSLSSMILVSYNDMLSQYTVIAIFLTMLIGTGGNAGNQSATIVIRGLTIVTGGCLS